MHEPSKPPLRVAVVDRAGLGLEPLLASAGVRVLPKDAEKFADVFLVSITCPYQLEEIARLTALAPHVRAVTIATYENSSLSADALAAGSSAHLAVPIDPSLLASTLQIVAEAPNFGGPPHVAQRRITGSDVDSDPAPITQDAPAPRLCIIDDDSLVREVLGRMCEKLGAHTSGFATRSEAIAADETGEWDLVLCDSRIPSDPLGEPEFLNALQEKNPSAVVALMSGGDRALPPGVHFFEKPLRAVDIRTIVDLAARKAPRYVA